MARVAYFDCFSGISGDMTLGALCDVGLDIDALRDMLATLDIPGWSINGQAEVRGWLAGTRMHVDAPEQSVHRHLHDVTQIITAATLPAQVKTQSLAIFQALADAEARVHGVSVNEVHFHEVGALDAIVDIVGVTAGLYLLDIAQVYASPLPLGQGWVRAAHGELPVPAPATLNILSAVQAPIVPDTATFELVTPTGAAIVATLAQFKRPAMQLERIGYGFGKKITERPNALRIWVGHTSTPAEQMVLLACNIDDQSAEQLAYVCDALMQKGARDVWQTPIYMKKGRAAITLSVLCDEPKEAALVDFIMRETSTFGMRRQLVERYVAERAQCTVTTPFGDIRVKRKYWQGSVLHNAPEYEDCAAAARQHCVPIHEIYAAALAAVPVI
jgi:uncharacterized protein (TIGR00299 family) protein